MRFRNLVKDRRTGKPAPIYFPYAGVNDRRGREVKGGELSLDLPPQRFFHPLLQRDWKKGAIEVLFDEKDKVVLQDATKGLMMETVPTTPVITTAVPEVVVTPPVAAPEPAPVVPVPEPVVEAPKSVEAISLSQLNTQPVPAPTEVPAPIAAPNTVPVPEVASFPPLSTVKPPAPAVIPETVAPPPTVIRHNVHPASQATPQGIPNMMTLPPQHFAGIPPAVSLAELRQQNQGLKG
jgi:hypothetical protein